MLNLENILEYIRQKLKKKLKFHPMIKSLHVFFSFFHPGMEFHPCLSSRDETLSQQKYVNGKDISPYTGMISFRDEVIVG